MPQNNPDVLNNASLNIINDCKNISEYNLIEYNESF